MSQRKLLLADDSITIQKVVNLTFADEGIEVITVGDGDAAMLKITEEAPDLVLADVNMPGLNGYQVCEQIRQSGARPQTPVILLVGSFEPFDRAEAERVGANDFLTKPFQSIRQLVNKVTELLAGSDSIETDAATEFENAETVSNFAVSDANDLPESSVAASTNSFGGFGDSTVDDELIQTSNASGFALDEAAKFESRTISEPEDAAQTQPLSAADLERFSGGASSESSNDSLEEVSSSNPSIDEMDEEKISTARNASQDEDKIEEVSAHTSTQSEPGFASSDDDDDLLELSYDDEEEWDEEEESEADESTAPVEGHSDESSTQAQSEQQSTAPISSSAVESDDYSETAATSPEQDLYSTAPEQSQGAFDSAAADSGTSASESIAESEQNRISTESSAFPAQLSPEMIDAIAQRVIEKLSDRAVKDVAWEVVPQMADLIIKKMVEEKLKQ